MIQTSAYDTKLAGILEIKPDFVAAALSDMPEAEKIELLEKVYSSKARGTFIGVPAITIVLALALASPFVGDDINNSKAAKSIFATSVFAALAVVFTDKRGQIHNQIQLAANKRLVDLASKPEI